MEKKGVPGRVLAAYCACFYAVWTVAEGWVWPLLGRVVTNPYGLQLLKSGLLKNAVWTLPACLLMMCYRDALAVDPRALFRRFAGWRRYLPVFAALAVVVLVAAMRTRRTLALSPAFSGEQMIVVLFVGITEEAVFRGWLLNATLPALGRWPALLLNATMFLGIHFPIWSAQGVFWKNLADGTFLGIMALSVLFGWAMLRSENLWVPVSLHMFYDLLCFLWI